MGTSIYQGHSAYTVRTGEASTNACILFPWREQVGLSHDSRTIANVTTPLLIPLPCRTWHLSVPYQPRGLRFRNLVDRAFFNGVSRDLTHANLYDRQPILYTTV